MSQSLDLEILMNAGNDLKVMKDAARRLQEFFASKNIRVQHAVALEALTASLGCQNWRTLRDKLSQPKDVPAAAPALSSEVALDGLPWTVHALYADGSPYSSYFAGETAMEAAVKALYDRIESGDQVSVVSVEERASGKSHPMYMLHGRELKTHGVLLQEMVRLARRQLGSREDVVGPALEDWRAENLVIELLEDLLQSARLREDLTDFTRLMPATLADADSCIGFAASDDLFMTLEPAVVLWTVANIVRRHEEELEKDELVLVYQYVALLETFEDKVARILVTHATQ